MRRTTRSVASINWVLGGKDSTFTEQAAPGQTLDRAGEIFAWEHDPEQVGPDTFTWFDNDAAPTELPYSRSVTVRLDFQNNTATLVSSDNSPKGCRPSPRATRRQRSTATSSSAGAPSRTSPSSAAPANWSSTPDSRPA